MNQFTLLQVICLSIFVLSCNGARILALLPFAFKSHHNFFQAILKELAGRGHEVVVYSPYSQEKHFPNYIDVYVNTSYSDKYITYKKVVESFAHSPLTVTPLLWKTMSLFTEQALQHENILKLAKSEENFDLVITETFMANEVFLAFGHKFSAPTLTFYSMGTFGVINYVMGNDLALSYIPNYVFPFSDKMSLYERFCSTLSTVYTLFLYYHDHIPRQQALLNHYLKFENTPILSKMIQNISMVFLNSHPITTYPQPLTPNLVQLGGIHISKERKPLPQDIQHFMNEAQHGVVYFSLGTFVPDHHLPPEYFENFVNVFKTMKQKVLWRSRAKSIAHLPENVKLVQWAPQQQVLAHPNCVLFLTHGGLLSVLEVVHAGVPVVGIPFFSDQALNIRFLQERGVAVHLDFLSLTEEKISAAFSTVLNNTRYKENALRLSLEFRDRPMSQSDLAVYWVEYVLRHGGGPHLRPASALMPWYQLILLDVLVTLTATVVLTLVALTWTFKKVSYRLRTSEKEVYSKKNQ